MRKIYCIAAAFVLFSFAGCGDGVDLPSLGVETDLNKIILPDNNINLVQVELKDNSVPMEKVGIHSEEDFARIREKKDMEEPWITGYQMLKESSFSQKNTDTKQRKQYRTNVFLMNFVVEYGIFFINVKSKKVDLVLKD